MCLCAALPEELITLHGKLVILQHPYECRYGNPSHKAYSVTAALTRTIRDLHVWEWPRMHKLSTICTTPRSLSCAITTGFRKDLA